MTDESTNTTPDPCDGDCRSCAAGGHGVHSHAMGTCQAPGGLEGWPLAGASAATFLLPLVCAAAGAMACDASAIAKVGSAAACFVVGVVLASVLTGWIRRHHEPNFTPESTDSDSNEHSDKETP